MSTTAFSGSDTIKINDRVLNDFADGDVLVLDYEGDLVAVKKGKSGNTIVTYSAQGEVAKVSLRLLRGSPDDKFMNDLLSRMRNDPSAFVLLTGEFTKVIGDGLGGKSTEIYIFSGGAFQKMPGGISTMESNPEASVIVYNLIFGNAPRSIG
jgi:hypothetical protein